MNISKTLRFLSMVIGIVVILNACFSSSLWNVLGYGICGIFFLFVSFSKDNKYSSVYLVSCSSILAMLSLNSMDKAMIQVLVISLSSIAIILSVINFYKLYNDR